MPAVIAFLGYNPLPLALTFPELLLRTRRTLGLDQAELAALLSVPFNTLHSWERGLFAPPAARREAVEQRIAALGSRDWHVLLPPPQPAPTATAARCASARHGCPAQRISPAVPAAGPGSRQSKE